MAKRSFKILFSLVFVFLLFVAVAACDGTPKEINVLGDWSTTSDVYTITKNTTDELSFSYDKGSEPNATLISAVIKENISKYQKLVITVQGNGTMALRLVGKDMTEPREVKLNVFGNAGTYEWTLAGEGNDAVDDVLKNVEKVEICAAPGKEDSSGEIMITALTFSKEAADGFIITNGFNNIPSNVNEYNGTDAEFHFNDKWADNGDGAYTITYANNVTKAVFNKTAGLEWAFIKTNIKGNFSGFNYLVVKVKGTSGQKLLAKVAEGVEDFVILNGGEQEIVVDFSGMTAANKNAIQEILLFGSAGAPGEGQFEIIDIYMTADYAYVPPVKNKNVYNGIDEAFHVDIWYDNGDGAYTVSKFGEEVVISYNKTHSGQDWATAVALLDGDISGFGILEFQMTGTENKSGLLKIEGGGVSKEVNVTFTGERQAVLMDLTDLSAADLKKIDKVLFFAAPGGIGTGAVTFHDVVFKNAESVGYSFIEGWVSNDEGVYAFEVQEDDSLKVTYEKGEFSWGYMKNVFDGAPGEMNVMTLVLKGPEGIEILIKPNDIGAFEQRVTLTGAEQEIVINTGNEAITFVIIFAEPDKTEEAGSFYILSAVLTYVAPPVGADEVVDINKDWVDNDGGIYDIKEVDGKVVIEYERTAEQSWAFIKTEFTADLSNHNTIIMKVKGPQGQSLIIKPNDNGAYEKTVEFNGEVQVIVFTLADKPNIILIFVDPIGGALSGAFEILSAKSSYVPQEYDLADGWVSNDEGVYIFDELDDSLKVSYDKGENEWAFMKHDFEGAGIGHNTLTLILKGTAGKTIMLKPNGLNSLEQTHEFDGNEQTVVLTVEDFSNIMLFAEPGTSGVTGEFYIISAVLGYVDRSPVPADEIVDVNGGWIDSDGGIYTFDEEDGKVTVSFERTEEQSWAFIKTIFDRNLSNHNTITFVLKGTAGQSVLIKPNDNNAFEKTVDFTGEEQTITITLTETPVNILLFVDPFEGALSGSFEILSVNVSYVPADYDLTTGWVSNDPGVYTFSEEGSALKVTYDKGTLEWAYMKHELSGADAGLNTLTLVVKGTAGASMLLKPNNDSALELSHEFSGEEQEIVITADSFTSLILFAEGGTADATGEFYIMSAVLSAK